MEEEVSPAQWFQNPVSRLTGRGVLEPEACEAVHIVFDIGRVESIHTVEVGKCSKSGPHPFPRAGC